jgi:hypothetical protein
VPNNTKDIQTLKGDVETEGSILYTIADQTKDTRD